MLLIKNCSQPSTDISLVMDINTTVPDDDFILLLTATIYFGKPEWNGDIMPVPFAVGGRIVGVV